jgi:hypothetical protein
MKKTSRRQFIVGMIALGLIGIAQIGRAEQMAQTGTEPAAAVEVEKPVLPFVPGSWTIIVLPDTQNYATSYPGLFNLQTQWVVDNKEKYNIVYVLQNGDVTNNNSELEWGRASQAFSRLDGVVPYVIVPGNHDYSVISDEGRVTRMNDYFPPSRLVKGPTCGGVMEEGRIDNSYHLFEAGGQEWLLLGLEWAPRNKVLEWANQILSRYPDRKAIIMTHAYLYYDSTRYDWAAKGNSQVATPKDGTGADANDGEDMWQKLVKKHANVFMTINGHVPGDGLGFLISEGDHSNPVYQILVDFQNLPLGGESWLRLIEFLPDGKTIQVKDYCPLYDKYNTGPENQFVIQMP